MKLIRLLPMLSALLLVMVLLSGCMTTRVQHYPQIDQPPRVVSISQPLQVSMTDNRRDRTNSEVLLSRMMAELRRVYGDSIEFIPRPADEQPPEGRVWVHLDIRALDANLGSRLVSPPDIPATAAGARSTSDRGGSASEKRTWWYGQSWITARLVDRRTAATKRVEQVFYADHANMNLLGRRSGERAAGGAWGDLEPDLLRFIDETLMSMR